MSGELHQRVVALDDISIRADGTGRTVTAYAAVFDSPAEIHDQDGHYDEQIARTAFDKTVRERGLNVGVFYNHARTLHGTPSERGSVPIGVPLEPPRADGRGLLTVTRYNKTGLADDVLESIRNGDIKGQSFTGQFIKSDPRGPYLPNRSTGDLTLVTRKEIALVEYGPTPIPAYSDAAIIGVRSADTERAEDQGNITTPNAADLNTAARRYAASQGWAMPDGSYPIRQADNHGRADLEAAVHAVGRGNDDHAEIRVHIVKRARAIGMTDLIPDDWSEGRGDGPASTSTSGGGATAPTAGTSAAQQGTGAAGRTAEAAATTPKPEPRTHSASTTRSTMKAGTMDERMTVEERTARQSEIRARLSEIDTEFSGATLPERTQTEWDDLNTEFGEHDRAIVAASQRAKLLKALGENPGATEGVDNSRAGYGQGAPNVIRRPDDIYDLNAVRNQARSIDEVPDLMRDRAMRAVETSKFPGVDNREDAQERAEKLLNGVDDERGTLARRMLTTGSPLYNRAFGKMVGKLSANGLTAEESRALALGVDASGGYAVPFQLDPTVILTSSGVINPLRQVSRVVQIVGKTWEGVTSAGITVTRGGEGDEASDNTPTLAQPSVDTSRVQGFVPFSVEIERSWSEMGGEITMLLQDAKDTEEANSFVNGDGTGDNPFGVIKTLATGSRVAAAATGAYTIPADVLAVEDAMAPRFRARASWIASKTTYNAIRQAAAADSTFMGDLWVRLSGGQPPELIGYPAYELSSMSTVAAHGGAANLVLALGDFQSGFIIVDRIGMSVELVPHLFGANGRPTGQRGIYAYWSNGSKVLVDNAIRVLNVTSAT